MKIEILKIKTGRTVYPMLTVYGNLRLQMNKEASTTLGLSEFQFYKAGILNGDLYLIPTTDRMYSQRAITAKGNGLINFNDVKWNEEAGFKANSHYMVERIDDEDGCFLKLTIISKRL